MPRDWSSYGIPGIFCEKPFCKFPDKLPLINMSFEFLKDKEIDGKKRWCFYIEGVPGCGKTHLACSMLKAFVIMQPQASAHFYTCKSYFQLLQDQFGDNTKSSHTWRKLKDLDLIVFDDIGTSRGTEWQREKIYDILEERFDSGKKTVITSNLSLSADAESENPLFDDRLYRRIQEGKVIKMQKSPYVEKRQLTKTA